MVLGVAREEEIGGGKLPEGFNEAMACALEAMANLEAEQILEAMANLEAEQILEAMANLEAEQILEAMAVHARTPGVA